MLDGFPSIIIWLSFEGRLSQIEDDIILTKAGQIF